MAPDAGLEVVNVQVGGLRQVIEPIQPALHVPEFRLDGLQPLALLPGRPVHLLVHQPYQLPDIALGQDVLPNLPHHHPFEPPGVQSGGVAGPAASLHQRLADVVGKPTALGVLAGKGAVAPLASDQAAEQIGAAHPAGVRPLGRPGAQHPVHPAELGRGDDGGERLRHPHRLGLVLRIRTPDQRAGVRLVPEDVVDAGLGPEPARGVGDALRVEGLGDVQHAPARLRHGEDAPDHRRRCRIRLQLRAFLGPIRYQDLVVAIRHAAGHPEPPGRRLAHPPRDLLRQILAIKLVHALDDGLHQLAGGGVVGGLGDGDHPDALAPQHGLEGHGVLALAGEAGELPDQDLLEGRVGAAGRLQHPAELWAIGDTPTLGLVHVLAGDDAAVLRGIGAKRPQLGGHREVNVLAVAGDPRVEGHRSVVRLLRDGHGVLVSSRLSCEPSARWPFTRRPRLGQLARRFRNRTLPPIVRHGAAWMAGLRHGGGTGASPADGGRVQRPGEGGVRAGLRWVTGL